MQNIVKFVGLEKRIPVKSVKKPGKNPGKQIFNPGESPAGERKQQINSRKDKGG
jgi:hypothetical protein